MSPDTTEPANERPPLSLEDVAAASLTIGAGADLGERATRLVTLIRTWVEPSAVLAVVRDLDAEAGLRALPELSFGHVGQGYERSLARLIEGAGPERSAAPWLIPPPPSVAGLRVKPLDSWLIPWNSGRVSGWLLLRGIAAPYPANLAQAVALAAQSVWPLVALAGAAAPAHSTAQTAEPPEPSDPAVPPAAPETVLDARLAQLEEAARTVQTVCAELRRQQSLPDSEHTTPAPPGAALREGVEALASARRELAELRAQCDALDRARLEATSECDQAQVERTSWRIQAETLQARLRAAEALRPADEAAQGHGPAHDKHVAELESALESARAEATALREQVTEHAAGAAEPGEAATLRAQLASAEQGRAQAEAERDELRAEFSRAVAEHTARLEALQARLAEVDELRTLLEAERTRGETERQALDGARQALKISEEMLAGQTGELEAVRRQRANLQEQVETAQRARAAAEAERDRARAEVNPLWGTIESLQRQIKEEQARSDAETARQAELQAELKQALAHAAELRSAAAEATAAGERARKAEERATALARRWDDSLSVLRSAYLALKRTPFVSPTLRLSFASAQALFEPAEASEARPAVEGAGRRMRVLLLDRDTPSLESLASELEVDGLEVVVAHYADEAAFFLKTPEARQLSALVADVMAFRSDAELLERFRVWRLELPALGLVVSYRADDTAEAERAKRLPLALGAGHVTRPLARQALVDTLTLSVRRATRPTEASAPGAPRPPVRRA